MDWARAVDPRKALLNCHAELIGDWYRDPWGWPELDWTVKTRPDLVLERIEHPGERSLCAIDVPKEGYMMRPAVIIDPIDRLAYQCLVDSVSRKLIGELRPQAFGWRLSPENPKAGIYPDNKDQWDSYQGHLKRLVFEYDCALKTDIVSCFASIRPEFVRDILYESVGDNVVVQRLLALLDGWARVPNRPGIPQRSLPSAVICNAILMRIDDILAHYSTRAILGTSELSFVRWMDDMWLFGYDPGRLRRAQVEIQEGLQALGLHINSGKTKLVEGDDVAAEALAVAHSAADDALDTDNDTVPLDQLIEAILDQK